MTMLVIGIMAGVLTGQLVILFIVLYKGEELAKWSQGK